MVKITSSESQSEETESIRPKRRVSKRLLIIGGIFLFILIGMVMGSGGGEKGNQSEVNTPVQPLSQEEQVRKLAEDQLQGTNNLKKPYVRKIDVVEQVNGGWGVFVEYNADDNLTTNLQKSGIEKKMSEIYIALYTSNQDIRSASVTAYFPLIDSFGNENDRVVYKSIFDKLVADKVNWSADSSTLKLSILPGIWTTSILHPEFQ